MSTDSTSTPQPTLQPTSQPTTKSNLTILSELEIQMSRVFDAPRALVWQALTDPAMLAQWWGLRQSHTVIDQYDLQPGGAWRFVEQSPEGREDAFRGEFREIVPLEKVVQTFEWEGLPGHIIVETMTLTDIGGRTQITNHSRFASVEDRDGMLASGMEGGANESWDQLGELLAKLQA